jgi:hypothetical protein
MQQFHVTGQQPVASHPINPGSQVPCRETKRPRITAFLFVGVKLEVARKSPLTNNEGRSVNDTSNSTSEKRPIVDVVRGLTRATSVSTARNGRLYRHGC